MQLFLIIYIRLLMWAMLSLQGASANSSSRSSLTNFAVHDADAAATTSDAESSQPAGAAVREATALSDAAATVPSDAAGSSKPQPAAALQGQHRGDTQRAVGFPIVPVKVTSATPAGASAGASEALSGPSSQLPAPAGDDHGEASMRNILGSEALAAALRDVNGSPGRAGITPYPVMGSHLARIAAQGREEVCLPRSSSLPCKHARH